MPLKVKSNNLDKYLVLADNIAPKMTNITATAGPKISASEATVMKIGPFCVLSFIAKITIQIAAGDTIFTLSPASSASFAIGIFGNGGQYGAKVT
ncbi:hypothetical protein [Dubosiella newyorkensis]|uniref:hypothetical protein n=1 Tax=Dubosiella newyorkensis TaxID=1862672 RepID=UPI00272E09A0|nr:hypothetical protein [Dubosiella newyorkensis]